MDNDGQYDDVTGINPSHTWSTVGTYIIGLRVTDSFGEIDTDTSTVDVREGDPLPPEDEYDVTVHRIIGLFVVSVA